MIRDRSKVRVESSTTGSATGEPARDAGARSRSSRWNSSSTFNRILGNIERSIKGQFSVDKDNDNNYNSKIRKNSRQQVRDRFELISGPSLRGDAGRKNKSQRETKTESRITSSSSSSSSRAFTNKSTGGETLGKMTPNKKEDQPTSMIYQTHMMASSKLSIPPPHANDEARNYNLFISTNVNRNNESTPLLGFDSSTCSSSSHDVNQLGGQICDRRPLGASNNATIIDNRQLKNGNYLSSGSSPASSARSLPNAPAFPPSHSDRSHHQTSGSQTQSNTKRNNNDDSEESGFSTYQSRRSLQAQTAQMYSQKLNSTNQQAGDHNKENNMFANYPRSYLSSTIMEHDGGMSNGRANVQQQQNGNHLFPHSQASLMRNQNFDRDQLPYLTTQQHNLRAINNVHLIQNDISKQVPIHPQLSPITSNNINFSGPPNQRFSTMGRSVPQHQRSSIVPNSTSNLDNQRQNFIGLPASIDTEQQQQQIYANAPPKPRRYLYYDNTTTYNHNMMMNQLAARLDNGVHPRQQQQMGRPQPSLPSKLNQSHYNLNSQPSVPSLFQEKSQLLDSYQNNRDATRANGSFLFPMQQHQPMLKSKSSLDPSDIVKFRQNRRASEQTNEQQIYCSRPSTIIHASSQVHSKPQNDLARNHFSQLSFNPQPGGNLARSKSVTHLLPESDGLQLSNTHDIPSRMLNCFRTENMARPEQSLRNLPAKSSASTTQLNLIGLNNRGLAFEPIRPSRTTMMMRHPSSQQLGEPMRQQSYPPNDNGNFSNHLVSSISLQKPHLQPIYSSGGFQVQLNTTNCNSSNGGSKTVTRLDNESLISSHSPMQRSSMVATAKATTNHLVGLANHSSSNQVSLPNSANRLPGLARQFTNNSTIMRDNEGSNQQHKSTLDEKIRHLLIGDADSSCVRGGAATQAFELMRPQPISRGFVDQDQQPIGANNLSNLACEAESNCNKERLLSAPCSLSSRPLMTQQERTTTTWMNNDFTSTTATLSSTTDRHQLPSLNSDSGGGGVISAGSASKHAFLENEKVFANPVEAPEAAGQSNGSASHQSTNNTSNGDLQQHKQVVNLQNRPDCLGDIPNDSNELQAMGGRQSKQSYQLDHTNGPVEPASRRNSRFTDSTSSQLIVDLTTPRVLAKTQTTLTNEVRGLSVAQQLNPWSINQSGLPNVDLVQSSCEPQSTSDKLVHDATDDKSLSLAHQDSAAESSTGSAQNGDNLERTAPYYYSDLKSKEQQQALLNIVQQKSLSPPPQLLSRSIDHNNTRLAPKSATMHLGHARTLSESFQQQRLRQQQKQLSMGSAQVLNNQPLAPVDSLNSIAQNIDKLFEVPANQMNSSKSMLTLTKPAGESGAEHTLQTAIQSQQNLTFDRSSKSRSLENIYQEARKDSKLNPVYENIRCSNKLMDALNDSASLSRGDRFQEADKLALRSSLNGNGVDSEGSTDSILDSSLGDSGSNSDLIDEIEVSSTDNHLNDINELINQLKTNHSKLTEEYKSTLVKISKTLSSKTRQTNDKKGDKLARRLQLLELKSKKCESRSKNQLALIQMMEKVLKQSRVKTSNDVRNESRSQVFSPSGSDSGQPTSFECDSSAKLGSSSNSKQSNSSSSSSQDRLNGSGYYSQDSRVSPKHEHCTKGESLGKDFHPSSEQQNEGDKNNNSPQVSPSSLGSGFASSMSNKRAEDQNRSPTIIRAIVTEGKKSQVELLKTERAIVESMGRCTMEDSSRKENGSRKSNNISQRILEIEKLQGKPDKKEPAAKALKKKSTNPFRSELTDSSVSLSSTDNLASSPLPKSDKSPSSPSKATFGANDESRIRNLPKTPEQDLDDDFIEFISTNGLSNCHSQFGASQFSASDFNSMETTPTEKSFSKKMAKESSAVSTRRDSLKNGEGKSSSNGILKNCSRNSGKRFDKAAELSSSEACSSTASETKVEEGKRGQKEELTRSGPLRRDDPSRRSVCSGLSIGGDSATNIASDQFNTVLGNVIDVDVCPLVNNISRCSPVSN